MSRVCFPMPARLCMARTVEVSWVLVAAVSRDASRPVRGCLAVSSPRSVGLVALISICGCALERAPLAEPPGQTRDGSADAGSGDDAGLDGGSGRPDSGGRDAGASDGAVVDGALRDAATDSGLTCVPVPEQCDAADNDCDGLVDESEGILPTCPCERHVFDGATYLFCSETETWEAARDACQSRGYELSIIETEAEDDWLSAESDFFDDAWIGLTRVSSSVYQWTNGETVWDDDPVGYTNFWDENPNTGRGRECGQLLNVSGRWWMERCGDAFPYICETPAPE